MPHDFIGWFHTVAAMIALITGSLILARTKGTTFHINTGKVYAVSMIIVCLTAFMIYRVHNSFGFLHLFALVSTITLALGMIPIYNRSQKNAIISHLSWMYWSVIGLYCAFAAEIFTRIPIIFELKSSYGIFYGLVGISTGIVGGLGSYFFKRKKKYWEIRFGRDGN